MHNIQVKLILNENQKKYIDKGIECKRKAANVIVKKCIALMNKVKHDKIHKENLEELSNINKEIKKLENKKDKTKTEEKELKELCKKKKEISERLKQRKEELKLTKNDIEKFAITQQKKYKKYISSQEMQIIVADIWKGVENVLYGSGKTLHYKKKGYYYTLSAKSDSNGIILCLDEKAVILGYKKKGTKVHFEVEQDDEYVKYSLKNNKPKYGRIVREIFNNGYRYYLQIVFEGTPMLKHKCGKGKIGIDPGVSTVASVAEKKCILEQLAPEIEKYDKQIKRLQRMMDASLRVNNPDAYDENGKYKKGAKLKRTKGFYKILRKLKTVYRKRTAYSIQCHNILANKILATGNEIFIENMDYMALAKRAKTLKKQDKESTIQKKDGTTITIKKFKKKKRFGKSINYRSPSKFIQILTYKSQFLEVPVSTINTKEFKASQYNHDTDEYVKKELKDRWTPIDGDYYQRDLYSAFLIQHSTDDLTHADRETCLKDFPNFKIYHDKCVYLICRDVPLRPSCFGF